MIGLVIDTNVIVSANLKLEGLEAKVVRWALNKQARLYVSPAVLDEYKRVLNYPKFKFTTSQVENFLRLLKKVSSLVRPKEQLSQCVHEEDNRFLECAYEAEAQFIITGNKKHFPASWKITKIVNAKEFLSEIILG